MRQITPPTSIPAEKIHTNFTSGQDLTNFRLIHNSIFELPD
jgi:hypothetical protein